MPKKGFFSISVKPVTIKKLQKLTDTIHSVFVPTTLIMMMNEIESGNYSIHSHKLSLDLSGTYVVITIRADVYEWLEKNFEKFAGEYEKKYQVKRFKFTKFVNYFILNMLESKYDSQSQTIDLDDSNFGWLQREYQKQKKNLQDVSFEDFTNIYIHDLFTKIEKERV